MSLFEIHPSLETKSSCNKVHVSCHGPFVIPGFFLRRYTYVFRLGSHTIKVIFRQEGPITFSSSVLPINQDPWFRSFIFGCESETSCS